jgi:hypothetical protein
MNTATSQMKAVSNQKRLLSHCRRAKMDAPQAIFNSKNTA